MGEKNFEKLLSYKLTRGDRDFAFVLSEQQLKQVTSLVNPIHGGGLCLAHAKIEFENLEETVQNLNSLTKHED